MAFVQRALVFVAALGAPLVVRGQTSHIVTVGLQGSFFDPPTISAGLNDIVTFNFSGFEHTVTQSSLANPCTPLPGGFSSGPAGTLGNGSRPAPTWDLTITNVSTPIWFFCEVTDPTSHCMTSGMVGVINPPSIAAYTQWRASAQQVKSTPVPDFGVVLTGVGAFATNTPAIPTASISTPTLSSTSSSPSSSNTTTSTDVLPTSSSTDGTSRSSSTSHLGAIVGGAVGGLAVLLLVIAGIMWSRRARRQRLENVSPSTDDANFFRYNPLPVRRPSEAFLEAKQLENVRRSTARKETAPARSPSNSAMQPNRRGDPVHPPGVPRVNEPFPNPPLNPASVQRQTSYGSNISSAVSPTSSDNSKNTINMHALATEVAGLLRQPSFKSPSAAAPNQNLTPEGGRGHTKQADSVRSGSDRTATPVGPPAYISAMTNSPEHRQTGT